MTAAAGFGIAATQMANTGGHLQDQADASAINAAVAIGGGANLQQATARIRAQLDQGQRVSLTLSDAGEVTATTKGDVEFIFGGLLGRWEATLEREATAVLAAGDPVCLLVLSPSQPSAFSRRGSSSLKAPGCAIQVNSRADGPLESRGGGGVETLRTLASGQGSEVQGFSPAPVYGTAPILDPYAKQTVWPSSQGCTPVNFDLKKEARSLSPGIHCGDITLGPDASLKLDAGTHVIVGSLSMQAGASLTTAKEATLVFIGPASTVTVQAGSDLQITAPVSGPWAGVALAIKPQLTELSSDIQGGGNVAIDGTVYMPSQRVFVTGGGTLAQPTDATRMFVVNRFELRGNGRVFLNAPTSPVTTAGGVRLTR